MYLSIKFSSRSSEKYCLLSPSSSEKSSIIGAFFKNAMNSFLFLKITQEVYLDPVIFFHFLARRLWRGTAPNSADSPVNNNEGESTDSETD